MQSGKPARPPAGALRRLHTALRLWHEPGGGDDWDAFRVLVAAGRVMGKHGRLPRRAHAALLNSAHMLLLGAEGVLPDMVAFACNCTEATVAGWRDPEGIEDVVGEAAASLQDVRDAIRAAGLCGLTAVEARGRVPELARARWDLEQAEQRARKSPELQARLRSLASRP